MEKNTLITRFWNSVQCGLTQILHRSPGYYASLFPPSGQIGDILFLLLKEQPCVLTF